MEFCDRFLKNEKLPWISVPEFSKKGNCHGRPFGKKEKQLIFQGNSNEKVVRCATFMAQL